MILPGLADKIIFSSSEVSVATVRDKLKGIGVWHDTIYETKYHGNVENNKITVHLYVMIPDAN